MEKLARDVKTFISSGNPSENEIEIRFRDISNSNSLQLHLFNKCLKYFKSNEKLWTFIKHTNDDVIIGKSLIKGHEDIRRISSKNSIVYQTKKRIKVNDNRNYYFRLSEAKETNISMTEEDWSTKCVPTLQRTRERNSFSDKSNTWQLDLTKVTSFGQINETSYEVELEYTNKTNKFNIDILKELFQDILSQIQNSPYIMSKTISDNLLSIYANLVNVNPRYPSFVGPLPYTLTKDVFDNGKLSCGYTVTEKADGDRKLFFIGNKGNTLLLSRPKNRQIQYQHIGLLPELENTIYDGEYIESTNTIYLFDTLVYKGKDIRNIPLDHRLEKLNSIVSKNVKSVLVNVKVKTFYMASEGRTIKIENGIKTSQHSENIYTISDQIWKKKDDYPYKLDGLIYTPINKNYYNTNIYKWKDSNTIDFFVKFISQNTWQLFISGLNSNNEYDHVPFEGTNKDGIFKLRKGSSFEFIESSIYKSDTTLSSGIITVSKSLSKLFKDSTIIEFKYYSGKFIPIRTRIDKSNANNIRAINDAWESITNNITITTIKNGVNRSCIRQYHNAIKSHLISKFCQQQYVLDIGSGAGGDIAKYKSARVTGLIGVDIVNVEYDHPTKYKFFKVDTELYNIKKLINDPKPFDIINCHFAFHYFFKSKDVFNNFAKNIVENMSNNGKLIITCMNGEKIFQLLSQNNIKKGQTLNIKFNDKSVFKIKKLYKDVDTIDKLTVFNQKIEVNLGGTKYFKLNNSLEYIVDFKKLNELLTPFKLKVLHIDSFSSYCKMFPYECQNMNISEKEFSFLNSVGIISKM